MEATRKKTAVELIKSVGILQLKVLLGAGRDLVLGSTALVAALFDLMMLGQHDEPRYFRAVLRFGEKTDRWIDVWSGGRDEDDEKRENADALLMRVEEVVRDPQTGARRARVLKRWAERQVQRARQRAGSQIATRLGAASSSRAVDRIADATSDRGQRDDASNGPNG